VNEDRGIGAMPKLYGAPAYARPPKVGVEPPARPFNPDDLPIESERTDLDQQLVEELAPSSYAQGGPASQPAPADPGSQSGGSSRGFPWRLPGLKG
jgi:hypothetical protein